MISNEPDFVRYRLDAVVDFIRPNQSMPHEVHLHTGQMTYSAQTWLKREQAGPALQIASATMLPVGDPNAPSYVVTELQPAIESDVFDLIPDHFGKDDNTVRRLRDAVDEVATQALRQFLSRVFSIKQVFYCFWTCPASQRHHHDYPGGLADHSLEMAEGALSHPHMSGTERDLAFTYAILHDVGKIWCYRSDGSYGEPLGHDLALLLHLHDALRELRSEWRDGDLVLRSLISGLWKQRGGRPVMAIGRLVQSLDQLSVERNLAENPRCDPKYKPWRPQDPRDKQVRDGIGDRFPAL